MEPTQILGLILGALFIAGLVVLVALVWLGFSAFR